MYGGGDGYLWSGVDVGAVVVVNGEVSVCGRMGSAPGVVDWVKRKKCRMGAARGTVEFVIFRRITSKA